jgi:hypothetical protein
MRRTAGIHRAAMGGTISRGALRRGGWDFGTTSETRTPLTRDDGGVRQAGSVRADHAVARQYNDPHSKGFRNPEKDYGPRDMGTAGHIDGSHTRPQYPQGAGYTKQADKRGPGASNARAMRTSDSETFMQEWYGYPARRR